MATIKNLDARPILDSRGQWTLEVLAKLSNGISACASVPQGKSRGSREARVLPAEKAVANVKNLSRAFGGINPENQAEIDAKLIMLDGTPNKSKLGANAILGISLACARAAAKNKHLPLWRHLRSFLNIKVSKSKKPWLFVNMINGGQHAGNNLDFQEYLVIPKVSSFMESAKLAAKIYHTLEEYLKKHFGRGATGLGDEGGFAPNFKSNTLPFAVLKQIVAKLGLKSKIAFGLDAAASDIKKSKQELQDFYSSLFRNYKLLYLEDAFGEEDFADFAGLLKKTRGKAWIAGDDLTTTNLSRVLEAHDADSMNAIIIKPNQIGTLTEALAVVEQAKKYKWKIIVSHRSGETNDDFIADFAYAVGADGLKLGAPARGERVAKYNRLLEIEREAEK